MVIHSFIRCSIAPNSLIKNTLNNDFSYPEIKKFAVLSFSPNKWEVKFKGTAENCYDAPPY